ncbi:AAA family ATPase [Actinoplanes sp. NPDC049265]|uniref:AAA family ATPase n=1 Tax=Actinoplanes sp. NPDC049265 TaxID=3363902 RepID=UPI003715850D
MLKERLRAGRRRSFVGRTGEIELFRRLLAAPSGVLFVHGPGGVGKSALLDVLAEVAAAEGVSVVRVDGRHLPPVAGALTVPPDTARLVLLIDTYEVLAPIDDWVWEEFLPLMPSDAVVVIAGRHAPGSRRLADPAWRGLLRVVALRNLPSRDARAFLTNLDVSSRLHDRLLTVSRGHPLALALLAEVVRRGTVPSTLGDFPDVLRALLAHAIDEVPGPRHRQALEVCAHANVTTEHLLRSVLGNEDVGDLFAWLRTLSFVEEGPYGLFPHDLVRDALDADLRWRDPDRYTALHSRVRDNLLARIRSAPDERAQQRLLADMIVVTCPRNRLAAYVSPMQAADRHIDELRAGDRAAVAAMTVAAQGAEQARLVAYWMDRRPEAFRVFRDASGEPRGYGACLDLTEADLGVDPGADAMWFYAQRHGPPRPGEQTRAWRFFLDRDEGQGSSPSLTLFATWQVLDVLNGGRTAWSLVGAYADADMWGPTLGYLDFWRATDADYTIGETRYPVFAHDWRRTGPAEWLELTAAREVGAPARPARERTPYLALSEPEFSDAVRAALRDLHVPARLRANPLLRSRVARDHDGLRELVDSAAATLPETLREIVDRTFLRPVTPQERVAESLHLSFSTYRRHRDRAVAHIVDWMWEREVYAAEPDHQAGTL